RTARARPGGPALTALSPASRTAGTAAGKSDTVAQPAHTPTRSPFRMSADGSAPTRQAAANANTRRAAENAGPMKIVASVQIGVASPNVSAANNAPASLAPSSTQ